MKQRVWNPIDKRKVAIGVMLVILLIAVYLLDHTNILTTPTAKIVHHGVFRTADPYWINAKETDYRSVPELMAQHRSELERGIKNDILMHGSTSQKEIALTFDDGPHPIYTRKILAILDKYDVKATFFVVGEMAERYPELIKAEIDDGHNIGNHTYHHVNLTKIPTGYVATEIAACDKVLQSVVSKPVRLFRPPGGDYNDRITEVSEVLAHTMVLWTDDPGDYASPGVEVIKERVLGSAKNGGIILIHDGVQQTIDALPYILRVLKEKGYQFVTVEAMLKERDRKL